MHAMLVAAALGTTFPLTLQGEVCITGTSGCSPVLATLQADRTGNFTITVLATIMGGPLQWGYDPATGRVGFLLGGTAPLIGAVTGGCARGTGVVPTPPPLLAIGGPSTLPVTFELCRVP